MSKENNELTEQNNGEMVTMNIYEKIQTAKKLLSDENIKKSGVNTFSNAKQSPQISQSVCRLTNINNRGNRAYDSLKYFNITGGKIK